MIDTIYLHLSPDFIPNQYVEFLIDKYPNLETSYKANILNYKLQLKNLFIIFNSITGFKIQNSWPKYKFGTNQQTLTLTDIINLTEELTQEFQLPLINSKVTRLDIAENIITKRPPELYCQILEDAKYFKKMDWHNGVAYKNTNRFIIFYDKKKEIKKQAVSPILKNQHVVRFEYRYSNHQSLANFLSLKTVSLSDVINNYQKLIDSWGDIFFTINKNHRLLQFKPEVFKQKGGLKQQIKASGIQALGGVEAVNQMIDNAKAEGLFTYNNVSSNEKKWVREIMKTPILTEKSDLAIELENKIRSIKLINSEQLHQGQIIKGGYHLPQQA